IPLFSVFWPPGACKAERTVNMTLKELCAMVKSEKENRNFGKKHLFERNDKVIAEKKSTMGKGTIKVNLMVFESGYVLYEEDDKSTIFHLDDICGKQVKYDTVESGFLSEAARTIPDEVYISADWSVRLMLEGNDRLMHNRASWESDHIEFSYSGISEAIKEVAYEPNYLEAFEAEIDAFHFEEMVSFLKSKVKPRQWDIFVSNRCDGIRQGDLAKAYGVSQQAISKDCLAVYKKIQKFHDRLEAFFED
ncbi:MAG: hypothetical protein J5959_06120, partial [Butyrivibrio sp.]|nr:hypothetical protein [Butyrivibrio sp.]